MWVCFAPSMEKQTWHIKQHSAPLSNEELLTIPCYRYINLEVEEADPNNRTSGSCSTGASLMSTVQSTRAAAALPGGAQGQVSGCGLASLPDLV